LQILEDTGKIQVLPVLCTSIVVPVSRPAASYYPKKQKKTCVDENSEILSKIKLDYDIENLICNNLIEDFIDNMSNMMKASRNTFQGRIY
jgi:hypothetical protein